ncbi:LrgB family protein [Paenibacillus pinihumi]|uniref:LrgB family protein n=1 Tax=Paenibacillus pinihumi TaxID=669462 RepID=UPI0003FC053A|nr:LrgB family protein [Paenibacillus pinihumi]
MNSEAFYDMPLFGMTVTVLFYTLAQLVNRRFRWLNPLFLTAGSLMLLLLVFKIPYTSYRAGGDIITFFLGPATVALAVPFYKYANKLKGQLLPIAAGVAAGAVSGLLSVWLLSSLLSASRETLLSMLPKSVTAPVAIEIARTLGGTPELAGVFTVLTGLLGSMIGPQLLKLCRIRSDAAIGTAMGTAAHGIGTARILRDSELQGGISGFAMGLSSMLTPLLCIPLGWW